MKRLFRVGGSFAVLSVVLLILTTEAFPASWNGIEPFKSRPVDVERILGKAISEGPNGALRFKVAGGSALISLVDEKFAANKRLKRETVGTVLEIVLQHENSSDTAESLGLTKNRAFDHEELPGASIYRNLKDGIIYTFVAGKLRTTRYTFSVRELSRARGTGR